MTLMKIVKVSFWLKNFPHSMYVKVSVSQLKLSAILFIWLHFSAQDAIKLKVLEHVFH